MCIRNRISHLHYKNWKINKMLQAWRKGVIVDVRALNSTKYVSYQRICQNILSRGQSQLSWVFEISHNSPDWSFATLSDSEMQIRSDQWYHRRAAPASSLSVKHASRHICKQLTGPFPAALFLRGLEGWHEADLIVPRLSLNLHVRCQLPCHRHSIAPTLTPNTAHALFKAATSNLGKRGEREEKNF